MKNRLEGSRTWRVETVVLTQRELSNPNLKLTFLKSLTAVQQPPSIGPLNRCSGQLCSHFYNIQDAGRLPEE